MKEFSHRPHFAGIAGDGGCKTCVKVLHAVKKSDIKNL